MRKEKDYEDVITDYMYRVFKGSRLEEIGLNIARKWLLDAVNCTSIKDLKW